MPPDQRRAAILDAVVPLLVQHGAAVTTKELAVAAGVAEGTLFTVFSGKRDLLIAAIERDLDPAPVVAGIAGAAVHPTFHDAAVAAAQVVLPRVEEVHALAAALRSIPETGPPGRTDGRTGGRTSGRTGGRTGGHVTDRPGRRQVPPAAAEAWHAAVLAALHDLTAPHASTLALEPGRVAAAFLALLLASRPHYGALNPPLSAQEIVHVLVHGVQASDRPGTAHLADDARTPPASPSTNGDSTCSST
jgi:AcrR family transcriptional regulator